MTTRVSVDRAGRVSGATSSPAVAHACAVDLEEIHALSDRNVPAPGEEPSRSAAPEPGLAKQCARDLRGQRVEQRDGAAARRPEARNGLVVQRDEAQRGAGDRFVEMDASPNRPVHLDAEPIPEEIGERNPAKRPDRGRNLRRDGHVDDARVFLVALARGAVRERDPCAARLRCFVQLRSNERIGEVRGRRLLERLERVRLEQILVLPGRFRRGLDQPVDGVLDCRGERVTRDAGPRASAASRLTRPRPASTSARESVAACSGPT